MKIREFYGYVKNILSEIDERCLIGEINMLLESYLKLNFTELVLSKNRDLTDSEFKILENAVNQRKNGVPLQYILGSWNFMGLDFKVGRGVLIPREDTSALVNIVLTRLKVEKVPKIIDLCSGSGAVAISIEKSVPNAEVYALEYSEEAFKYLTLNINSLNSYVEAVRGDIFKDYEKFDDSFFDFIVSNPPYIKTDDIKSLENEVLKEPLMALDGGEDGLDFYEAICKFWISKLKTGGFLAFEIGEGMFENVKEIMESYGLKEIDFMRDINGIIRSVIGGKTG